MGMRYTESRTDRTRAVHGVLDAAGKMWAFPNTMVGIILGLVGMPFGAKLRWTSNALWFENYPLGQGAITIGNTVISSPGWGPDECRIIYGTMQNIGRHEMG